MPSLQQQEQLSQPVVVPVDPALEQAAAEIAFNEEATRLMLEASRLGEGDKDESEESPFDVIGQHLAKEFAEAESHRQEREEEWLKDLRQYKGQYDPQVEAKIDPRRSHAFIRLTRSKVRATDARLADMLFPAGDKNWMLTASPVPSIAPDEEQLLRAQIMQRDGGQIDEDGFKKALEEVAEKKAEGMSKVIDDQLSEGNYPAVARDVMHSGHLYGTGVLKGPMVETRPMRRWKTQTINGKTEFVPTEETKVKPFFHEVSIWNIYPDPYAITLDECDYIWERHVMTKHEVRKLRRRKDFDQGRIDKYLREHPSGSGVSLKNHENELRTMSGTRTTIVQPQNRYEVLERWGYMDGQRLADMGVKVPDDQLDKEFEAVVWLLGDVVIKVSLNPFDTASRPYKFYYFEKDETSIWGVGIPHLMRDPQKLFNAAIRIMVDNAAISSGPQVELNTELLAEEGDITSLTPFRIWLRKGRGADGAFPLMKVHQIDSKVTEFMKMAELFQSFGDESTSIPRFTYAGNEGSQISKTVGGLSMLMGQANVVLKDVAKNWDDGVTTPFISDVYGWNMQFSEDNEIKGDYDVIARGASSLVAKELRSHALDAFAASVANPMDDPYIKRAELLRERAVALDLNPESFLRTQDEVFSLQQMQQQLQVFGGVIAGIAAKLGLSPEQLVQTEMAAQQQPQQPQPQAPVAA